MAQYKNGREAELGDTVVGADGKGVPVAGVVVMLHAVDASEPVNMAVSQDSALVGDLKSADFLHTDDAKPITAASEPTAVVAAE